MDTIWQDIRYAVRTLVKTPGVRPAAGRFFSPDDDRTRGTHPVAVIGYGLWQRRFGGSADTIGRTIALNRITFTIAGIAPEGFRGVGASLLLAAVAFVGSYLPARRASRFDPLIALRQP